MSALLLANALSLSFSAQSEVETLAPKLGALLRFAESDPGLLAYKFENETHSTHAHLVSKLELSPLATANTLPVVTAHGMGDSCFNAGMKSITKAAGDRLGVYSTCIPTGDNIISDTLNGFLMTIDKSVDVFAAKVKADPKLAGGFNAFGLSQGNILIRGYIAKYNDPPVHTYMSICGTNAGVAAFPDCTPDIPIVGGICETLTEVLGDLAYNPLVQGILFQANYFRDPEKISSDAYLKNSALAKWNGETTKDMTIDKANFAKTSKFVWVEGLKDSVVWPREGEQWGAPSPDYPKVKKAVPMAETAWYTGDTFGLAAADAAGKHAMETFDGDHIRFTDAELEAWLDKYFV